MQPADSASKELITFRYCSDLAALARPRVAVLDTTFAHHSWDFETQVSVNNETCNTVPFYHRICF
jgi:hypothetical protein